MESPCREIDRRAESEHRKRERTGPFRGQVEGGCKGKFRARPGDRVQEGHFKNLADSPGSQST